MSEKTPAPDAALEEQIPQNEEGPKEVAPEGKGGEEVEEKVEKIEDPGQLEGLSKEVKEKKEHEPPVDSPRYKQIYYEAKEGKRQVTDLTKKNEELEKRIAKMESAPPPPAPPEEAPPPEPSKVDGYKEEIKELRVKRSEALKDLDGEEAAKIADKIDDIKDKISDIRFDEIKKKKVDPTEISKAVEKKEVQAAVNSFIKANPWFSSNPRDGASNQHYNPDKSSYAMGLEENMKGTWKGTQSELFDEIAKKVETTFHPQKAASPKLPAVASVSILNKTKVTGDTLTDEQKHVARNMFPNHKDPEGYYAKHITK